LLSDQDLNCSILDSSRYFPLTLSFTTTRAEKYDRMDCVRYKENCNITWTRCEIGRTICDIGRTRGDIGGRVHNLRSFLEIASKINLLYHLPLANLSFATLTQSYVINM
jgi:hypothetical protein